MLKCAKTERWQDGQLDIDDSGGAGQPATGRVLYKRVTVPLGRACWNHVTSADITSAPNDLWCERASRAERSEAWTESQSPEYILGHFRLRNARGSASGQPLTCWFQLLRHVINYFKHLLCLYFAFSHIHYRMIVQRNRFWVLLEISF